MLLPAAPNSSEPPNDVEPENKDLPPSGRLRIEVHQDEVIYDVLTTLARVQASVKQLRYESRRIELIYEASPFVLRRIPSLMASLVNVIEVEQLGFE